jgi:hypothetical protein
MFVKFTISEARRTAAVWISEAILRISEAILRISEAIPLIQYG